MLASDDTSFLAVEVTEGSEIFTRREDVSPCLEAEEVRVLSSWQ